MTHKKSNLSKIDNSGIDYARMLLFVSLVYWKMKANCLTFSCLSQHLTKLSHQCYQRNKMSRCGGHIELYYKVILKQFYFNKT